MTDLQKLTKAIIQLPPARIDVVKETVHQSQIVAEGCGQDYALVTYDLTTAKMANRIQSKETPICDNLFIFFGSFHTEMSFFAAQKNWLHWECITMDYKDYKKL